MRNFPRGRAITTTEVDCISVPDPKIVAEADGKRKCPDLYGLLSIPNEAKNWEHVFSIYQLEKRLRIEKRPVTWRDVFEHNLFVKVRQRGTLA